MVALHCFKNIKPAMHLWKKTNSVVMLFLLLLDLFFLGLMGSFESLV
jgi:hypothetical protein